MMINYYLKRILYAISKTITLVLCECLMNIITQHIAYTKKDNVIVSFTIGNVCNTNPTYLNLTKTCRGYSTRYGRVYVRFDKGWK